MKTWKEILIEPMQSRLIKALIDEITNDRSNMPCDDVSVMTVVLSFVAVEEYKKKNALLVSCLY